MRIKKLKNLYYIFIVAFTISTFTFGGGYTVVPMMRKYFVEKLEFIDEDELLNISAIAHSTPGAIAVNIPVLVGYKVNGLIGAVVAGIGTITPPLIILSIISVFYKSFRDNIIVTKVLKGMEAGVVAIIVDVLIDMWQTVRLEKNILLTLIAPLAFVANYVFNINVIYIIVTTAIICLIQSQINQNKNSLTEVYHE